MSESQPFPPEFGPLPSMLTEPDRAVAWALGQVTSPEARQTLASVIHDLAVELQTRRGDVIRLNERHEAYVDGVDAIIDGKNGEIRALRAMMPNDQTTLTLNEPPAGNGRHRAEDVHDDDCDWDLNGPCDCGVCP